MALSAPELVEVEKFARALEKPEPKLLRDNSLVSKAKCVLDKVKDNCREFQSKVDATGLHCLY